MLLKKKKKILFKDSSNRNKPKTLQIFSYLKNNLGKFQKNKNNFEKNNLFCIKLSKISMLKKMLKKSLFINIKLLKQKHRKKN